MIKLALASIMLFSMPYLSAAEKAKKTDGDGKGGIIGDAAEALIAPVLSPFLRILQTGNNNSSNGTIDRARQTSDHDETTREIMVATTRAMVEMEQNNTRKNEALQQKVESLSAQYAQLKETVQTTSDGHNKRITEIETKLKNPKKRWSLMSCCGISCCTVDQD